MSTYSRISNPLGFTQPFIFFFSKILIQELNKSKLDWDDEVSPEIKQNWLKWVSEISLITNLSFPHCILPFANYDNLELHVLHELHEFNWVCVGELLSFHEQ